MPTCGALRSGDGHKYVQEFDKPQSSPCQLFAKEKGNGTVKASNPFEMAKKAASSSLKEDFSLLWLLQRYRTLVGTVSVRQFYYELQDIMKNELKGKHTNPPTSLMGQILARILLHQPRGPRITIKWLVIEYVNKSVEERSRKPAKWESAQTDSLGLMQ